MTDTASVVIHRPERAMIRVPIVGESPLIVHKWSEKSLRQMRDKQMQVDAGKTKKKHDAKNPDQEAYDATYWMPDGRGALPAVNFKAAMVGACRLIETLPMTRAKTTIFVKGEGPEMLIPIEGPYEMREDTPRLASGVSDLRYRNAFYPWSAVLEIHFIKNIVDHQSVINLVEAAGLGGVGEWRPSSPKSHTGMYGTFRVDTSKSIEMAGV